MRLAAQTCLGGRSGAACAGKGLGLGPSSLPVTHQFIRNCKTAYLGFQASPGPWGRGRGGMTVLLKAPRLCPRCPGLPRPPSAPAPKSALPHAHRLRSRHRSLRVSLLKPEPAQTSSFGLVRALMSGGGFCAVSRGRLGTGLGTTLGVALRPQLPPGEVRSPALCTPAAALPYPPLSWAAVP